VDLFFELHDGSIWGLPGRLLFDAAGLALFFLSASGLYIWYYPRRARRRKRRGAAGGSGRAYRLLRRQHLRWGSIAAVCLLASGGTGLFMRPPLLALIAGRSLDPGHYPGPLTDNPWEDRIHNAVYDGRRDRLILAADGFWQGPQDFSRPFEELEIDAPLFVMGATVFEADAAGDLLQGSFSGLFRVGPAGGPAVDLVSRDEKAPRSSVRPGEFMVTGYFRTPEGACYVNTHEQGLLRLADGAQRSAEIRPATLTLEASVPPSSPDIRRFSMPAEMAAGYRMPLWNYLFELHNGRFFKGLLGGFHMLVIPLGALLYGLLTLSGMASRLLKRRRREAALRRADGARRP